MKQCDELIMAAGGEKSLQVMMGLLEDVKEQVDIPEFDNVESVESIEQ